MPAANTLTNGRVFFFQPGLTIARMDARGPDGRRDSHGGPYPTNQEVGEVSVSASLRLS